MSGNKYDLLHHYFDNLQNDFKLFLNSKKELNDAFLGYIYKFQLIETKVNKALFNALIFYKNQREFYNRRIQKLRKEEASDKRKLDLLLKKKKDLTIPKLDSNIPTSIKNTEEYIKELENQIYDLNKTLEVQILDINEENNIVEKIRKLEIDKEDSIQRLKELEQKHNNPCFS